MPSRLIPAQIRGARGALGWSMLELARAAGVSVSTIKRVENADPGAVSDETASKIRGTLETAGLWFSENEDGSLGIHFRSRSD